MRVRELDALHAPDELLRALNALETDASAELTPGEPPWSAERAIAYYRHTPAGQPRRRWLAESGAELVGSAALYVHAPRLVYVQLAVLPKHRRQGIGTALLAAVRAAAREHGIAAFYGHHATPAGAAFAAHVGARDDQRDVRSMLALGGARLPAPVVAEGFELRSWLGSAPAELVASYARAREAMSDAPVPDGQVATTSTVEEVRDLEQTAARRGREVRVTTALNAAGDVVAFTDLRVSAPPEFDAATDDTGTVRAWRGRGLALAVKLESLRRLRDDRPDVQSVWTVNAEDNAAMRHINERIGFVPTVTLTSTVLEA